MSDIVNLGTTELTDDRILIPAIVRAIGRSKKNGSVRLRLEGKLPNDKDIGTVWMTCNGTVINGGAFNGSTTAERTFAGLERVALSNMTPEQAKAYQADNKVPIEAVINAPVTAVFTEDDEEASGFNFVWMYAENDGVSAELEGTDLNDLLAGPVADETEDADGDDIPDDMT